MLRVSADEHPDLFWALRGGGGNFGVVTSFEYRLHPVSMVLGGLVIHPRDRATDLLKFYRSFTQSAPDELAAYAALMYTPDGHPVSAIAVCYSGDLAEGERLLAPLRSFGTPLVDTIQPMPFPVMQTLLDAAVPDGNQNYWKSSFLRELERRGDRCHRQPREPGDLPDDGGADRAVRRRGRPRGEERHGLRAAPCRVQLRLLTQWVDPAESERHIAWTRGFADAMMPFRSGDYLLNFLGDENEDTIRASFGPNYARLVEVKTRYDPTNFFRVNQNVKPDSAAVAG